MASSTIESLASSMNEFHTPVDNGHKKWIEGSTPTLPDPEKVFARLKDRIQTSAEAMNDKDRAKYAELSRKLAASLEIRSKRLSEWASDAATKVMEEFRSGLSREQRSLYEETEHSVIHGVERRAGVIAEDAKKVYHEVRNDGARALEAVKSGDVKEVRQLADWIKEKVNASGERLLEYTGVKALEKAFEPMKQDGIGGILAVLMNLWNILKNWLSGDGFSLSEAADKAKDAAQSAASGVMGVGAVDTAKDRASRWIKEADRFLNERAYRQEVILKNLPKIEKSISNEFFEGGSLSPAQSEGLKDMLMNVSFGQDTYEKIRARLEKGDGTLAQSSDAADLIMELTFGNMNILWELMSRGIIPTSRVGIHAFQTGMESYKFNVAIVFHKLHLPNPPVISLTAEELSLKLESADKNLKEFLLVEMYRVNGFMASLLGSAAALSASLTNALLVDTSTKVDGIDMFKKNWAGRFDLLIKDIETLERGLFKSGWFTGSEMQGIAAELRAHLTQVKENFAVLEQLKADPTNKVLQAKVRTLGDPATIRNTFQKLLGTKAGIAAEYLDSLHHIQTYQVGLAKGDILSRMRGLFGSMEIMKMPRMADKVMLHFPSLEAAKETLNTLRQAAAYAPEFLNSFFRGLPVAGLVIAGVDVANSNESTNASLISFVKAASSILVPFVWPLALFFSDTHWVKFVRNGQTGEIEIENLGTGLAAVGMLGVDTALLVKAISTNTVGKFMTSRVTDVAKFWGDIVKFGSLWRKATIKLAPQLGKMMSVVNVLPRKLKLAAVFALTLWGSAYAYARSHEDIESKLVEDGFWDKKTQNITPKLLSRFGQLDPEEKRLFLDGMYLTFVEKAGQNLPETESSFENGKYTLVTKRGESMRDVWEVLNVRHPQFGEELQKLGVVLDVATTDRAYN